MDTAPPGSGPLHHDRSRRSVAATRSRTNRAAAARSPGDLDRRGGRRGVEELERQRRQRAEQQHHQRVAALDHRDVDVAALGPQPVDVGGEARALVVGQRRRGSLAELHLAEQQLAEVEAVGLRAPEPEVDEHQLRAVRSDEQVAGAGVAVRGAVRQGLQLGDDRGQGVGGGDEVAAQRVVERGGDDRVAPDLVVVQGGDDLQRRAGPRRSCAGVRCCPGSATVASGRTRGLAASRPSRCAARASAARSQRAATTGTSSSQSAVDSASRSTTAYARGIVRPGGNRSARSLR